jgi:hypothetical protein
VVVVITGEEDDSLAPQLALQEVEAPGLAEGVLHRREEEVEDVPQQDHLVDLVEPGLQPLQRVPVRQERITGPGAEVHVGDRKRPHRR